MARYPDAGQVLWAAPVKDKVKKVETKESRHQDKSSTVMKKLKHKHPPLSRKIQS
jgi:hypothetical protein